LRQIKVSSVFLSNSALLEIVIAKIPAVFFFEKEISATAILASRWRARTAVHKPIFSFSLAKFFENEKSPDVACGKSGLFFEDQ